MPRITEAWKNIIIIRHRIYKMDHLVMSTRRLVSLFSGLRPSLSSSLLPLQAELCNKNNERRITKLRLTARNRRRGPRLTGSAPDERRGGCPPKRGSCLFFEKTQIMHFVTPDCHFDREKQWGQILDYHFFSLMWTLGLFHSLDYAASR